MTTAHHLDIGSSQPGSVGVVVCADSYAEGLRFRALKVYDQGRRNDALWRMITDNVRVSDLVVGDMDAQIAACHVGASRLLDLVERYGLATLTDAIEDLFDYSERLMRSQIAKLKDGTYTRDRRTSTVSSAATTPRSRICRSRSRSRSPAAISRST